MEDGSVLPLLRADAINCDIRDFDSVGHGDVTLQRLVVAGKLNVLDPRAVAWNMKHHSLEVHIVSWHNSGGAAPCPIPDGTRIAIKLHRGLIAENGRHIPQIPIHTRAPESVVAGLFAPHRMAGEYHELLSLLQDIHTGTSDETRPGGRRPGLMLQDISAGNLLVQAQEDGSCRLLLSDPSMAGFIEHMPHQSGARYIVSTWLWGSMTAKMQRFDPGADLFSLSFTFLEAWAVAEGFPVPLREMTQYIKADLIKPKGLAFARALCVEVLKRHVYCSTIQPRVQRELPVSYFMLWALLLGTEDFVSCAQVGTGVLHRRPSEIDMVDVACRLAIITKSVQSLEGGLTADLLATPAGCSLVSACTKLHSRLLHLSQLHPLAEGINMNPPDSSLVWVATHFMAQQHPLVQAMACQGVEHVPGYKAAPPVLLEGIPKTFQGAVHAAQNTVGWAVAYQPLVDAHKEEAAESKAALLDIYQAYQQTTLEEALQLPPPLRRALQRAAQQAARWTAPVTAAAAAPKPPEAALPAAAVAAGAGTGTHVSAQLAEAAASGCTEGSALPPAGSSRASCRTGAAEQAVVPKLAASAGLEGQDQCLPAIQLMAGGAAARSPSLSPNKRRRGEMGQASVAATQK